MAVDGSSSSNLLASIFTPQFFDALVIGVIIAGLILAAARIIHDFRSGPRWPAPSDTSEDEAEEQEE
jgi:hypothetical protein